MTVRNKFTSAQPYVSSTYRPLLRSLGGVSPVGMLSTEHELQQVLINSVLDFFELVVSPPRQKGPGTHKAIRMGARSRDRKQQR